MRNEEKIHVRFFFSKGLARAKDEDNTPHSGSDARIDAEALAASELSVAVPVGVEPLGLDVSFAEAAEGLTVGLTEGKAPATLAQRSGERRPMAMSGKKKCRMNGRTDG